MTEQNKAVEATAKRIAKVAGAEWPQDANRYRKMAEAALSHTATSEVEPVAWLYKTASGIERHVFASERLPANKQRGLIETPLYASTPTPTPDSGLAGELGERLERLHSDLTPGRIENADIDGHAFTVKDALTALQSNSDSELLREVADRAAEFVAACKPMIYPKPDKPETDYGRMVALEKALARLEQGAA